MVVGEVKDEGIESMEYFGLCGITLGIASLKLMTYSFLLQLPLIDRYNRKSINRSSKIDYFICIFAPSIFYGIILKIYYYENGTLPFLSSAVTPIEKEAVLPLVWFNAVTSNEKVIIDFGSTVHQAIPHVTLIL